MKMNSGASRRRGSPKTREAGKAKLVDGDAPGDHGLLQGRPEVRSFVRPRKLTKRQARRLEQEEVRAASGLGDSTHSLSSSSSSSSPSSSSKYSPDAQNKRSKKRLSKKQARRQKRLELQNTGNFKGPSAPDPGKKIGRSGNIAYGGHGEEWRNTSFAKRIGNNHMLRVKREQAARLRQLEAQDAPSSVLSGKAKKQMLKERRARKREQKRLKAAAEEEEAAIAAELSMQAARLSNLELDCTVSMTPSASSFFAKIASSVADGSPPPQGKQLMYQCFLDDVAASVPSNAAIPKRNGTRPPRTLRVMTFNVHFFQRGYSGEEHGDNRTCINQIVGHLKPDVIFLQEVVAMDVSCGDGGSTVVDAASIKAIFNPALGYNFATFALASDCHVLPDSVCCAPGQRLAVAIASRIPLQSCAPVALGGGTNGNAASAVLKIDEGLTLGLYTAHLSVRCANASTRREEVCGVVAHAEEALASARIDECLFGGDFNQPVCRDYEPEVWTCMVQDMESAGLPLSDGVAELLRDGGADAEAGVWVTSFDDAESRTPPISAWNGTTVDYIYRRKKKNSTFTCTGSWIWYGGGDSSDLVPPSDHLPIVCDYTWG